MKFEEILPALREGKKIRKRHWCKGSYIYIDFDFNGELVAQSGKSVEIILGRLCDLEKDEWEIIKETKKVKLRDLTIEQYNEWVDNHCQEYNEYCDKCPFQKVKCEKDGGQNSLWINNKDLYSDKFLDQEIEIEVEK